MAVEVKMPQLGESIAEGTLVRWLKKEGDSVARDEPLFEISTDKVDTEIPSPSEGVLKEIKVQEGETVAVETVVALLDSDSENGKEAKPEKREKKEKEKAKKEKKRAKEEEEEEEKEREEEVEKEQEEEEEKAKEKPEKEPKQQEQEEEKKKQKKVETAQARDGSAEEGEEEEAESPEPAAEVEDSEDSAESSGAESAAAESDGAESDGRGRRRSSPLVRRIAREHDIDLGRVEGTGPGGRITKRDILSVVEEDEDGAEGEAAPPEPARGPKARRDRPPAPSIEPVAALPDLAADDVRIEPMSNMRLRIAEHMAQSKRTSAHVTTVFEVDMTAIAGKIAEFRKPFLEASGAKLTYLPFIMKAAIGGLREQPAINAAIAGKEVRYFRKINLGIAVAIDGGLIVPVVKDAEEKSLIGLARSVKDLAERARARKLRPDEVRDGTFTITNHGVFGSLFATPIISQPQAGILGVGAVTKRPVVLPETDAIAIRSMVYLGFSYDHRLVDGAVADKFLARVKDILENGSFSPLEA